MMDGRRKSDRPVVPEKPSNKALERAAETMEERGLAEGNLPERNALRTQSRVSVPSALERVRQAARRDRKQRFTALLHHVYDIDRLRTAYHGLTRDAAAGVDGETWRAYGDNLEANLRDLADRLQRGAYRAKPVRRAFIPKADGRQRPLGVPTLEDKLVQRAVVEVLNVIYEGDFLGFSYGFRRGRSPHHALDALSAGILTRKVSWVLDADIRGFFDMLSQEWLVRFVEHRVADRRVVRLIQKWLRAGVLEDGKRIVSEVGTVQGGSISPLLANLYLHHVFDLWVQRWRKRQARGDVVVVRFGDDFVVGFQHRHEAERFLAELRERFAKFGLELHPDKTRLIPFGRFAGTGETKPPTFNFLGFTHSCGKTRRGRFHPAADDAPEVAGEAESGKSRAQAAHASAHPRARRLSAVGRFWTRPLLRRAHERPGNKRLPPCRWLALAPCPQTAQPERSPAAPVGPDETHHRPVASARSYLASISPRPARRHDPRQEPDAVIPHVRICGGGRGQPRFLLRLPSNDET
jgi:RNA-directed DNA polymerase